MTTAPQITTPRSPRNPLPEALAAMVEELSVDLDTRTARAGALTVTGDSASRVRANLISAVYDQFHTRATHEPVLDPDRDETALFEAGTPHREIGIPVRILQHGGHHDRHTGEPASIVVAEGLRVVAPLRVLRAGEADPSQAVMTVPSWRTRTTPGFFLVLGPHGSPTAPESVRFYVALDDPGEGHYLWPRLLGALNSAGLRYQAKVLSNTALYPRSDALVVYGAATDEQPLGRLLAQQTAPLGPAQVPGSVFTRRLTSRVRVAEEPQDPRPPYRGLSFGQHRSTVVVDALFAAAHQHRTVEDALAEQCWLAGLDVQDMSRNAPREPVTAPDLRTPRSAPADP